jgi:hypothetical protein
VRGPCLDWFVGRVEEEIGDVIGALLVVEAGFLAVEGEMPEPDVLADRILAEWWSYGVME